MGVNVKEFGAKGDGTTNDTAAIQSAIAALPASGGVLFFPAGTYLITPGTPAFSLGDKTLVEGEGRNASFLKSINSPAASSRFFDISGGRVEFHRLSFAGPTTFGGQKVVQAVRATNAVGIEIYMENCGCQGVNRLAQMFSGVSQLIEVVDCDFDGADIGDPAGADQAAATCILGPHVGGGVIARNTRFRRWGSGATEGTNLNHVLYLANQTPLLVDNCRFESHRDGRYIQVFGEAEGSPATGEYWAVRDSFFGAQVVQNYAVQTSPSIRGLISNCQFNTSKASICPQGDAQIEHCEFRGGTGGTFYSILLVAASCKVGIRDCVFIGSTAIDVFIEGSSCQVEVEGCEFRESSAYAHVCPNEGTTGIELRVRGCLFRPSGGVPGIITETGTVAALTVEGCAFIGGNRGINISAGTVTLMLLLNNHFAGQSTAAVTKTGTVTAENSRDNIGYSDVSSASVASVATLTLPADARFVNITGTTTITKVTATSAGDIRVLKFSSTAGLTDGSNLKLKENFAATADDTVTLACDGTNWYEMSRSAN